MPHIAITMIPGRTEETKKDLAVKVRDLIARELSVEENIISVSIEDVPLENWDKSMERIPRNTMYID